MHWVIGSNLNCVLVGWSTSARTIPMDRSTHMLSLEMAHWRSMNESRRLCVGMLTDPLWRMCQLESFRQWIRTQMLFRIYALISIIGHNSEIMRIIQKKRAWIGPMWQEGELSCWCDGMIHLIGSMYNCLQCVGWGCKLLNPGQTFEIIGIIQDIMRIIVLVHLKRWTWLRTESLPGHPKALLPLLDTYQSLLGA